jgi:hypothetical protein
MMMNPVLSAEDIALDIQHFENQITETEQKLERLRKCKALLEDCSTVYHIGRIGRYEEA